MYIQLSNSLTVVGMRSAFKPRRCSVVSGHRKSGVSPPIHSAIFVRSASSCDRIHASQLPYGPDVSMCIFTRYQALACTCASSTFW